jgi:hypothetical protein
MKETAVEFLLGQMFMNDILFSKTAIDKALEMEKEQKKQEYLKGMKEANELRLAQEKQMDNL